MYHDTHEPNASLRYKISGGSPAGCYSVDGASDCAVATAGSPDGITSWSDVAPLRFAKPWRPDCHTNLFFDTRKGEYMMTTRDYTRGTGRDISMTVTGKGAAVPKHYTGNWSLVMSGKYPPTTEAVPCKHTKGEPSSAVEDCGAVCRKTDNCALFWVYTEGHDAGLCCPKQSVQAGEPMVPACKTCGGEFCKYCTRAIPTTA